MILNLIFLKCHFQTNFQESISSQIKSSKISLSNNSSKFRFLRFNLQFSIYQIILFYFISFYLKIPSSFNFQNLNSHFFLVIIIFVIIIIIILFIILFICFKISSLNNSSKIWLPNLIFNLKISLFTFIRLNIILINK